MPKRKPEPETVRRFDERVVGIHTDAKFLWVVCDSGRVMVGERGEGGVKWGEVEPVPGTRRAYIVNALRQEKAKEAASGEK